MEVVLGEGAQQSIHVCYIIKTWNGVASNGKELTRPLLGIPIIYPITLMTQDVYVYVYVQ